MLKEIVNVITKYLSDKKILTVEIEIFKFGLYRWLLFSFQCALLIFISMKINKTIECLLYIILFAKLRDYIGGYHSNNAWICTCLYLFNYLLLCVIINQDITYIIYYHFVIVCITFIVKPNVKKRSYILPYKENRKKLILIYIFITILIIIFPNNIKNTIVITEIIVLFYKIIDDRKEIKKMLENLLKSLCNMIINSVYNSVNFVSFKGQHNEKEPEELIEYAKKINKD